MKFGKVSLCLLLSLLLALSGNYKTYAATIEDNAIEINSFDDVTFEAKAWDIIYFKLAVEKAGKLTINIKGADYSDYINVYDISGTSIAEDRGDRSIIANLEKGTYYIKFDENKGRSFNERNRTLRIATSFSPDTQPKVEFKISLNKGDTLQLGTIVNVKDEKITWKSSKKSVATVSSKGLVKAVKKGTTKISAVLDSGKLADITIEVK